MAYEKNATVSVQLKEVSTGRTVTHQIEWDFNHPNAEEGLEFIFSEGNYRCDCNRELFFYRALDTPEHEIPDGGCGDDRFIVLAVRRISDGKIFYQDPFRADLQTPDSLEQVSYSTDDET